jgi:hypothetical protein
MSRSSFTDLTGNSNRAVNFMLEKVSRKGGIVILNCKQRPEVRSMYVLMAKDTCDRNSRIIADEGEGISFLNEHGRVQNSYYGSRILGV